MSVVALINPLAGFGRGLRYVKPIKKILNKMGLRAKFLFLRKDQSVLEAISHIDDSFNFLLIVGGDGTVKSVVEAVFSLDRKFVLIPFLGGTGGELSRYLRIISIKDLIRVFSVGKICYVDVFKADVKVLNNPIKQHFIVANMQIGHFSQAIKSTPILMKKIFGGTGYMFGVFKAIVERINKVCLLECDGKKVYFGKIYTIHLGNMKTTRGGIPVTPLASPTDEKIDILLGKEIGRFEALKILPKVLRGKHLYHPAVIYRQAKEVRIWCDGEHVAIDGEYLGKLKYAKIGYFGKIKTLCAK